MESTSPVNGRQVDLGWSSPSQRAFLAAYATCGKIGAAAKSAGVARSRHYAWLEQPAYKEAFRLAQQLAGDQLEDEAVRRARDGMTEPVLHQGKVVFAWVDGNGKYVEEGDPRAVHKVAVTRHTYSDRLLAMLLAAVKPEKFGRRQEVTHRRQFEVRFDSPEEKLRRVQEVLSLVRQELNGSSSQMP